MPLLILAYMDLISHALPVIGGLKSRRRLQGPSLLFFFVVLLSGIVEVATYVMSRNGIHNLWLIQCYHLLDVTLTMTALTAWQKAGVLRTIERFVIAVYAFVWIGAKFTFEPLTGADQFTHTTASILVLCTAIITLFHFVQDEDSPFVREGKFWLAGGVLIYFAGNFLLFSVFGTFIQLPSIDAKMIWTVHWGISILVNVIYFYGFLRLKE